MFAAMAMSLFNTPKSIATPCSVKAKGGADVGLVDVVTNCDDISRTSLAVSWNIKSGGNRLRFLYNSPNRRTGTCPGRGYRAHF